MPSHHAFCQCCASPLERGTPIQECSECGLQIWHNPTPVALAVVPLLEDLNSGGGRLLAVRRSIPPKVGSFSFPGGHVDFMESIEQAALRELKEETGFDIGDDTPIRLLGSMVPPVNKLLVFCAFPPLPRSAILDFVENREASEAGWLSPFDDWAFPAQLSSLGCFNDALLSFAVKNKDWFVSRRT